MSQIKQPTLHHNQFVVDVSKNEQEVLNFLHSYGIVETCKIFSAKKYWFPVYHYIQLSGDSKLQYLYVKICGAFEGKHKLTEVSFEEFKKYVTEKVRQSNLN